MAPSIASFTRASELVTATVITREIVSRSGNATRRLALVIANLGWGGAQKVMTAMANHWASIGWEITLISVDGRRVECYFPPLPQVRLVYLGASAPSDSVGKALFHNGRRVAALRRAIRTARAEAVISFLSATNVLTILAARGLGVPVIVSERGDPIGHRCRVRGGSARGPTPLPTALWHRPKVRSPDSGGAFDGAGRSSPIRWRPSVTDRTMADVESPALAIWYRSRDSTC